MNEAHLRVLIFLLVASLSGCTSPGDQYQAASIAFVAVVDVATVAREAGALDKEAVTEITILVNRGFKLLNEWAAALKAREDYPVGTELLQAVVSAIQRHVREE